MSFLRVEKPKIEIEAAYQPFIEFYNQINAMSDELGWPDEWLICPQCSAFSWRLPPHMFDSCPIIVEMAQSAGLKLDAERSAAIRSGVTLEKQFEVFRKMIEGEIQEEGDE